MTDLVDRVVISFLSGLWGDFVIVFLVCMRLVILVSVILILKAEIALNNSSKFTDQYIMFTGK